MQPYSYIVAAPYSADVQCRDGCHAVQWTTKYKICIWVSIFIISLIYFLLIQPGIRIDLESSLILTTVWNRVSDLVLFVFGLFSRQKIAVQLWSTCAAMARTGAYITLAIMFRLGAPIENNAGTSLLVKHTLCLLSLLHLVSVHNSIHWSEDMTYLALCILIITTTCTRVTSHRHTDTHILKTLICTWPAIHLIHALNVSDHWILIVASIHQYATNWHWHALFNNYLARRSPTPRHQAPLRDQSLRQAGDAVRTNCGHSARLPMERCGRILWVVGDPACRTSERRLDFAATSARSHFSLWWAWQRNSVL